MGADCQSRVELRRRTGSEQSPVQGAREGRAPLTGREAELGTGRLSGGRRAGVDRRLGQGDIRSDLPGVGCGRVVREAVDVRRAHRELVVPDRHVDQAMRRRAGSKGLAVDRALERRGWLVGRERELDIRAVRVLRPGVDGRLRGSDHEPGVGRRRAVDIAGEIDRADLEEVHADQEVLVRVALRAAARHEGRQLGRIEAALEPEQHERREIVRAREAEDRLLGKARVARRCLDRRVRSRSVGLVDERVARRRRVDVAGLVDGPHLEGVLAVLDLEHGMRARTGSERHLHGRRPPAPDSQDPALEEELGHAAYVVAAGEAEHRHAVGRARGVRDHGLGRRLVRRGRSVDELVRTHITAVTRGPVDAALVGRRARLDTSVDRDAGGLQRVRGGRTSVVADRLEQRVDVAAVAEGVEKAAGPAIEVAALRGEHRVAATTLAAAADDRVAQHDRRVGNRWEGRYEIGLRSRDAAPERSGVRPDGHVDEVELPVRVVEDAAAGHLRGVAGDGHVLDQRVAVADAVEAAARTAAPCCRAVSSRSRRRRSPARSRSRRRSRPCSLRSRCRAWRTHGWMCSESHRRPRAPCCLRSSDG